MPKVQAASSEDAELDAARSAGDQRLVLTLLMARYGDAIYRFAMAMTRDHNLAEEVRQQVVTATSTPPGSSGTQPRPCEDAQTVHS